MGSLGHLRILRIKYLPGIFPITDSRCSLVGSFSALDLSFFSDNLAQFHQFSVILSNKVLFWYVNQL